LDLTKAARFFLATTYQNGKKLHTYDQKYTKTGKSYIHMTKKISKREKVTYDQKVFQNVKKLKVTYDQNIYQNGKKLKVTYDQNIYQIWGGVDERVL
jgi:hypothetical protein